jgi:hypothetical protein
MVCGRADNKLNVTPAEMMLWFAVVAGLDAEPGSVSRSPRRA